jgi:hypothetical protein
MPMNKYIFISIQFFLLFFLFGSLNAQSRQNKVLLKLEKKSNILNHATGWEQNKETGKWVENKNIILDRESSDYWISHTFQNFKWLQFATTIVNNNRYFILLYEKANGRDNRYGEWEEYISTFYFILTQHQYDDLTKEITLKSAKNVVFKSNMHGFISTEYEILGGEFLYNEENLLAKITNSIEKNENYEFCFLVNSQHVDGQEVVRFRLPDTCFSNEEKMGYSYFEVLQSDFKTILKFD